MTENLIKVIISHIIPDNYYTTLVNKLHKNHLIFLQIFYHFAINFFLKYFSNNF